MHFYEHESSNCVAVNARIIRRHLFGLLAIATSIAAPCVADEARSTTPQRVLADIGVRGVFDPSVTEDPATRRLWMSYSSFEVSSHSESGVALRVAFSDDGETWRDAGAVQGFTDVVAGPFQANEAGEVEIESGSPGTWQNESSTLVYDARAPREQRWKLIWHQTLWVDDIPRYVSYSWIALKMADSPESLVRAPPIKLFTGYLTRSAGESRAAPAFSPIPEPPAIRLDKKDPQLGACIFGQPAAISAADGLYLALDCAWLGTRPQLHTVLLRCAYPNCVVTDPASWTVVVRLTEPRDGPQLDKRYEGFGGTALAEKNGRYYLIATPFASEGHRYDGCNVYRFEDFAYGKLERQRNGQLVVAQTVRGIPETHHGACAAHARLKSILLSQIVRTASPRVMQIRQSGVALP
jgi:hypothetical protein